MTKTRHPGYGFTVINHQLLVPLLFGMVALCLMVRVATCNAEAGSIGVGGFERTYQVFKPDDLRSGAPLVIVLHGGFGTGHDAEMRYGWDASATRHGFAVVYPDGIGHSWNAGGCCGPAQKRNIDDVAFISALIDRLVQDGADPRRVYVAGISNGGAMAYRYACEGDRPVAAIGVVSGALAVPCAGRVPSLIAIHGTADRNIPIAGGNGDKGVTHYEWSAFDTTLNAWRRVLECSTPVYSRVGDVLTRTSKCGQGAEVVQVTINGAGHQWPGSLQTRPIASALLRLDPPSRAIDATEVLTAFFLRHMLD